MHKLDWPRRRLDRGRSARGEDATVGVEVGGDEGLAGDVGADGVHGFRFGADLIEPTFVFGAFTSRRKCICDARWLD